MASIERQPRVGQVVDWPDIDIIIELQAGSVCRCDARARSTSKPCVSMVTGIHPSERQREAH